MATTYQPMPLTDANDSIGNQFEDPTPMIATASQTRNTALNGGPKRVDTVLARTRALSANGKALSRSPREMAASIEIGAAPKTRYHANSAAHRRWVSAIPQENCAARDKASITAADGGVRRPSMNSSEPV